MTKESPTTSVELDDGTTITRTDVIEAFDQAKDEPPYESHTKRVYVDGRGKGVKDVYRNLPGVSNDTTLHTHRIEDLFETLGFEIGADDDSTDTTIADGIGQVWHFGFNNGWWELFRENSCVSIGFPGANTDLSELVDVEAIVSNTGLEEDSQHPRSPAEQLRKFVHEVQIGDILVIKDGQRYEDDNSWAGGGKIPAIGVVSGEYQYEQAEDWYDNLPDELTQTENHHHRQVDWIIDLESSEEGWFQPEVLIQQWTIDDVDYEEIKQQLLDTRGLEAELKELEQRSVLAGGEYNSIEDESPEVPEEVAFYWVNQGNQAEIRDEYIRAKVDDVWHHDLDQVDAGDVVFHNFEDELIGVSTVTDWREQYSFQDATFQRVGVEFQWFDEPVSVDAELKGELDDPEFQQKYYPVNSEGNLKQAYLAKLSPAAAEFLLDRVEGWCQLRTVDTDRTDKSPVPEKPDEATTLARQLEAEKQIVLYGPPGTGKTYTAERFARWWVAQQDHSVAVEDRIETVTFHPSFTYEDFVEGLTAEASDDGQIAYEVQDGILKRLSETATDAYEEAQETGTDAPRFVLVIDEINRGNLAQIFGETITLLEADKRGTTTVRLAHSDSEFTLPPNLYVIGTMNTADRSIALVDAALRRRFRFISRPPAFDAVVAAHDLPEQPIGTGDAFESLLAASIAALQEMNDRIVQSADLGKGKQIGHTRLFGVDTAEDIRDVWRFDILPLLEEYYFGQFDRIRQELFDGGGEALFDWERKQIRDFTVQELGDTLSAFVEGNVELPTAAQSAEEASGSARKRWDRDTFFDAIEASFDDEITAVCRDFFEFGSTEADRVGYGTGKQTGAAQFYWDAYRDGDYLVYELRTDGTLQFRFWGAEKYDPELFEVFLDRIRPVLEDPIDVEYLLSDEFTRLQIPLERVQDDESRERVKDAIRTFVTDAADRAP